MKPNRLRDLWDGCYDGEHRKLLSPEQFRQMFCNVCLNPGCTNSRGSTSKWNQRMLTQEDRLLHNPAFAPERSDERMGIPDFKNLIQEALRVEISTQRADWEPVSDADVGRAAAEMMGVVPLSPTGFRPDPIPDPRPILHPSPKKIWPSPPRKSDTPMTFRDKFTTSGGCVGTRRTSKANRRRTR